ncbi:MAG: hypothetical protein V1772_04420, partial [Chloroflexota bacterium]
MLGHLVYAAFRLGGATFRFRLVGRERLPGGGPCLLVGNHARSVGPIQAVLALPLRLYPWAVADNLDYR